MRKFPFIKFKTKKGAASFYVVIFTTLVLSVITLSFVRIMLSESTNTINSDLSRSAYDSALAGVEDAKSALIKCQRDGGKDCYKIYAKDQSQQPQCNGVASYLYGRQDGEIQLSETQDGKGGTESQAYTCVKVSDQLTDYRVTLTSSTRIKVIPLNVEGEGEGGFGEAKKINVSWYSRNNDDKNGDVDWVSKLRTRQNNEQLPFNARGVAEDSSHDDKTPSIVSAELIQTDSTFNFSELIEEGNSKGTNRALSILYPVKEGGDKGDIGLIPTGNSSTTHKPSYITCKGFKSESPSEFACNATLTIPPTSSGSAAKNNETAFLVITNPYSQGDVDFRISVLGEGDKELTFKNAQYAVDSTGRANDVYRRIETRVELGNINFPYPEYVAQIGLSKDDKAGLEKNFWVTHDCARTNGELLKGSDTNYRTETCDNSGEVKKEQQK